MVGARMMSVVVACDVGVHVCSGLNGWFISVAALGRRCGSCCQHTPYGAWMGGEWRGAVGESV